MGSLGTLRVVGVVTFKPLRQIPFRRVRRAQPFARFGNARNVSVLLVLGGKEDAC